MENIGLVKNEAEEIKPRYLRSVFGLKCSRCRTGQMFVSKSSYKLKSFMKMYDRCPACGQHLELEVGFYYGTSYVSYILSILVSAITFTAWCLTIGVSTTDGRIFWWMGINIVLLILLQPYLMRLSRALWLSIFVIYNPRWRVETSEVPERIVVSEMNNW